MLHRAAWLLLLILSLAGCHTQPKPATDISGKYVGWMWLDNKFDPQDGSMGTTRWIELHADGTYRSHQDTKVMMDFHSDGKGTYVVAGDKITFNGSAETYMNDGYRKGTETVPQQMSLDFIDGMMRLTDGKREPFYYRKEGTGPPPTPDVLKLKPSDPAAAALLKQTVETYAHLASYRDTGTMQSQGGGFAATDVKFSTEFTRPNHLHFQCAKYDHGKKWGWTDVKWDGKKTLWSSDEYAPNTERPLGNALSIIAVDYGDEAELVPSLLIPDVLGGPGVDRYKQIRRLPDERVGSVNCTVLELKNASPQATKLWIDPRSHLILKEFEGIRETTVTYSPTVKN